MRRIELVQKISRIGFIVLFVSALSLIGGVFIMQVTSSSYQLTYTPTTQNGDDFLPDNYLVIGSESIEQGCCGHEDSTAPLITLITPGNTSVLLAGHIIAFDITDDNPMEDFLAEEVTYNWDGGSNTTLTSPFNISMAGADGEHTLNVYAVDALDNWGSKVFKFTTTSNPGEVNIIGVDLPTTTTLPRRADGFLLLTAVPIFIASAIIVARRKK